MSATPRRVTWLDDSDLQCAMLAALGFSTKMICERTGLTPCQVSYRLNKGRIKRKDYRDGTSAVAERVIDRVIPQAGSTKRQILGLTPIILKP